MKRILSVILSLILVISCTAAMAQGVELDISRSKSAEKLDDAGETTVSLSLPSAEEKLSSDVVFVLDASDCAGDVVTQMSVLAQELSAAQKRTGADIKVGVVLFRGSAAPMFDGQLVPAEEAAATLEKMAGELAASSSSFWQELVMTSYVHAKDYIIKGSNLHAGLMAAEKMLKADTQVADGRKSVITITDGMTYYWNDEKDNVYGIYSSSDANGQNFPSLLFYGWCEAYDIPQGPYTLSGKINASNWDSYIAATRKKVDESYFVNVRDAKTVLNSSDSGVRFSTIDALNTAGYKYISKADGENIAHGIEVSVLKCLDTTREMAEMGYHCYTVNPSPDKYGADTFIGLFTTKLSETAGTSSVDFSSIQNDILYAVDAGSTVRDSIGDHFDLIDDSFTMTVGGNELVKLKQGDTIIFGGQDAASARFTVKIENRSFLWTINEPVSNFAPVQLSYKLRLNEAGKKAGNHGINDLNGDGMADEGGAKYTDGCFTNSSAILTPVNSSGNAGTPLAFPKPSLEHRQKIAGNITITPLDLTDYAGGNGYGITDITSDMVHSSQSGMPVPVFRITGISADEAASLVITDNNPHNNPDAQHSNQWKAVRIGTTDYFYIVGAQNNLPIAVKYMNGNQLMGYRETFSPETVHDLFMELTIELVLEEDPSTGLLADITAASGNSVYTVNAGKGRLTVREIVDSTSADTVTPVISAAPASPVKSGSAVAVTSPGTTFTLNNYSVPLSSQAGISLLFDDIYDTPALNRTEKLIEDAEARAAAQLSPLQNGEIRNFEAKYIDLVAVNDGNAVVSASNPVTVYWGYPDGTDMNTQFTLLHYTGLHRDGKASGYDAADISQSLIETVPVRNTPSGIEFRQNSFSPFLLTWNSVPSGKLYSCTLRYVEKDSGKKLLPDKKMTDLQQAEMTVRAEEIPGYVALEETKTVKLTDGENVITFQYEKAPDVPKTGDSSNMMLWIALLTFSAALMAIVLRKKAKNK